MGKIMITLFSLILFSTMTALAREPAADGRRLSFVGTLGLALGGDELPTDPDPEKSDDNDINAGDALGVKLGVIVQPSVQYPDWEVQATLGWKGEGEFGEDDNPDGRFSRYPLDLIGFYKFNRLRCGAGLTYHFNPKLEGDHIPVDVDGDFDNALGAILEIDYLIGSHFLLGATYEIIEYESDTDKADGSNFGLFIGFRF